MLIIYKDLANWKWFIIFTYRYYRNIYYQSDLIYITHYIYININTHVFPALRLEIIVDMISVIYINRHLSN